MVLMSTLLLFGWSVRILLQPLILELGLSPNVASGMYFLFSAMAVVAGLVVSRSAG